jgi:16S rRNA processing protein RimM
MTRDTGSARRVLLGHISSAHGIRGAVLVRTYTGEPEAIADYGQLESEDGRTHYDLEIDGVTAKGVICRVAGVTDRTQAEKLKGEALYVARDRLPPPADGEYYHADLVGLAAVTEEGAALGTVVGVANYGAGDILEVEPLGAKRTDLYPMTEDVVRAVDLARGVIVLAPPGEVDAGDANGADAVD